MREEDGGVVHCTAESACGAMAERAVVLGGREGGEFVRVRPGSFGFEEGELETGSIDRAAG